MRAEGEEGMGTKETWLEANSSIHKNKQNHQCPFTFTHFYFYLSNTNFTISYKIYKVSKTVQEAILSRLLVVFRVQEMKQNVAGVLLL